MIFKKRHRLWFFQKTVMNIKIVWKWIKWRWMARFRIFVQTWHFHVQFRKKGRFPFSQNFRNISGSTVNGTRFVGSSHWKIPRKSGKSKKVVPFSRLEFPNGMSCFIYVSRSLYQFQVHGRTPPRTGVYDQMEQLFTNRKFHFCHHRNFRVFFLNGKRPKTRHSCSLNWEWTWMTQV